MGPQYFLLGGQGYLPISLKDKILGSIVPNYADPIAEYQPSDAVHLESRMAISQSVNDFTIQAVTSSTTGAKARLQGVAGLATSVNSSHSIDLRGGELVCTRLQQHASLLQRLMEVPIVRDRVMVWTKRALFRPPSVCMIVGVVLCKGTTMTVIDTKRKEVEASGLLPIATVGLAAMGIPPLGIPMGDLAVGGQRGSERTVEMSGRIDDMVIIGLQLRIVRRRTWVSQVRLSRRALSIAPERHLAGNDDESESDDSQDESESQRLEDAEQELGDSPWRYDDAAIDLAD